MMLSGPGRGSAAGSLVAYALGITQIDPIKYGLLFSRFLTTGERMGFVDEDYGRPVSGDFVELTDDTGRRLILDLRLSVKIERNGKYMEVKVSDLQENDKLLD
jgi:hypothetical protein